MQDPTRQSPRVQSRYREVSRRAFLRRAAQAAGALAALPLISSCGNDAQAFAGTTTTTLPPTTSATTDEGTTSTTTSATTTSPTTAAPATTATTADPVTASEMLIAFTYSAAGGRVRNPYVAVWIEDEAGELVDTVALWFLQSRKGLRYLTDLRRWYAADGSSSTIDTISSATRSPGAYSVAWDLTNMDGQPVAGGQYYVCIEAAREHGPYSLIRESISFEDAVAEVQLPDDGELTNASVSLA